MLVDARLSTAAFSTTTFYDTFWQKIVKRFVVKTYHLSCKLWNQTDLHNDNCDLHMFCFCCNLPMSKKYIKKLYQKLPAHNKVNLQLFKKQVCYNFIPSEMIFGKIKYSGSSGCIWGMKNKFSIGKTKITFYDHGGHRT